MKTVYVGLSGGVDSSVAAALLQQQGFRVVGVYMQNWTTNVAGVNCPWEQDLADAKAVAAALNIPLKVFDFQTQYKKLVVDVMVAEFKAGRTPNPDVLCNQDIKFKLFLETALADGADLIATGHYARVLGGRLLKGQDDWKDQSYFLYRVTSAALERTIMPIGEMHKPAVRALAAKLYLPTANKPDSQGICFVGEVNIKDFLQQYLPAKPGDIVLASSGQTVGQHEGAHFYTIGQRHGLGVGGGRPYYIVAKDMVKNIVYVSNDSRDDQLMIDKFTISDVHWINHLPAKGQVYEVLPRYKGKLIGCQLVPDESSYTVIMDRKERAITPGQSAVIYEGDQVIGGGIVQSVEYPKNDVSNQKTLVKTNS
jgi:tRNA-uridine 2-sulfurtransferase